MAWDDGITSKPQRSSEEAKLQMALWQHIKLLKPKNVIAYHAANGEHRSKRTAGRLKAMGVVPGVPDLSLVLADGRAAFMELKAIGGRLSPAQKAFEEQCAAMEVEHAVVSDLDTGLRILRAWGVLPEEK
jgi:hypothetical protein